MKRKILVFALIIFTLINLTSCNGSDGKELTMDEARISLSNRLEKMSSSLNESELIKDLGDGKEATSSLYDQLPDAETEYPPSVVGNADIVIEIASSPEKAGSGTNGALLKVAENFNSEGYTIDGKTVAVSVTCIASGEAVDYIGSGKYVWDVYSPSSQYWGEILKAQGININMLTDRIAGNTAGFVFEKSIYDSFTQKYGEATAGTVAQAVNDGELSFGYTNPRASSTGLNFLISMLYSFDSQNPLSSTAANEFIEFSRNINHLSYTTIQLTTKVSNGSVNAFVYEYQNYKNTAGISDYVFVPFGIRHDNPVYTVGELSADKNAAAEMFVSYCLESKSQDIFASFGFNEQNNYKSEELGVSGSALMSAQDLWKEEKNTSEVAVVFVVDTSGSMYGEAINNMQSTLTELIGEIDTNHYIGLVSYSTDVNIDLPIAKFDSTQQAYFRGAVKNLVSAGNTSTNDALLVATDMLMTWGDNNPNVKPMIILMSDGLQTDGYKLGEVSNIFKGLGIPINTVSYNTDATDLEILAALNEGAQISATTDNVLYKLKSFLGASL